MYFYLKKRKKKNYLEFETLIIATIETTNAAGATKYTKLTKTPLNTSPITGIAFIELLVAINVMDAIKKRDMFLSSMFKRPTTNPKIIKTVESHTGWLIL